MIASRENKVSLPRMVQDKKELDRKWLTEKLGDFLLDIAKLIFGGVVLAGIMETDVNPYWLFSIGGGVAVWVAFIGFYVLVLFNRKK